MREVHYYMKWKIAAEYHAATGKWTATAKGNRQSYGCADVSAKRVVRGLLYMIGDRDADVTVTINGPSWALIDSLEEK